MTIIPEGGKICLGTYSISMFLWFPACPSISQNASKNKFKKDSKIAHSRPWKSISSESFLWHPHFVRFGCPNRSKIRYNKIDSKIEVQNVSKPKRRPNLNKHEVRKLGSQFSRIGVILGSCLNPFWTMFGILFASVVVRCLDPFLNLFDTFFDSFLDHLFYMCFEASLVVLTFPIDASP